jgi:molybdopterin converting factor subunit 1
MIEINARYFAAFRERAGRDSEQVRTTAGTAAELYAELAARHGFADAVGRCKVAINDRLSDWTAPLAEGDHVLFFPPVAGG